MGQICSFCKPGGREEAAKSYAFDNRGSNPATTTNISDLRPGTGYGAGGGPNSILNAADRGMFNGELASVDVTIGSSSQQLGHGKDFVSGGARTSPDDLEAVQAAAERLRTAQEEKEKLERIVSDAGREMVNVQRRGFTLSDHHHMGTMGGDILGTYGGATAAMAMQNLQNHGVLSNVAMRPLHANNAAEIAMVRSGVVGTTSEIIETLCRGHWDGVELGSKEGGLAGCGGEDPNIFLDDCAEGFLAIVLPTQESFNGCLPIVENLP